MNMTINQGLRAMAGLFVVLSVALGWFVHPGFYLFTAFVGLNLLQSAFSNWCPAMWVLKKAGFRAEAPVNGTAADKKACCS